MAVDTVGFREAHEHLVAHTAELRDVAALLPDLTIPERITARRKALRHLREQVEPHTMLDERLLYPAVADRLGDPLIAVSMNYDHMAIRRWIEKIAATDVTDTARLQALLYGLDALIRVHIWKENELFLALLDASSWPE